MLGFQALDYRTEQHSAFDTRTLHSEGMLVFTGRTR